MKSRIPVLIVGAGPVGLLMASELARHQINFKIIDKKLNPTSGSNATWIQPGTLEIFNHIGIVDAFIRHGHRCDAIHVHTKDKASTRVTLEHIDSIYPFILMLPQSITEQLFAQHLKKYKIKVNSATELTDVKQQNNSVIATIQHPNGEVEKIQCQWLIACDGVNSTVRARCGITFPGDDVPEQFMVADAHMDSYMFKNEIHVFFDKGSICGVFPMGHDNYRINANLNQGAPRKLFIDKEVMEIINDRTYDSYNINSVSWISPFWIHGRLIKQMRSGSIFFMGDAAHTHSPVGGQGMNAGFQDAYNLAWKLALVIKGKADENLLDSYHQERHPIIRKIVSQTDKATRMALFDKTFLKKLNQFSHKILHSPIKFIKKITMRLTQLDIHYKNSAIINYANHANNKSPKSGEHAPNIALNASTDLYHYLRNTQHNILLFSGIKNDKNKFNKLKQLQDKLNATYSGDVNTYIVSTEKLKNCDLIFDCDANLHRHYHIDTPAVYILRPDNVIAYCSNKLNYKSIEKCLAKYLLFK